MDTPRETTRPEQPGAGPEPPHGDPLGAEAGPRPHGDHPRAAGGTTPHGDPVYEEWRRYGRDPFDAGPSGYDHEGGAGDSFPPPPRGRGPLDFSAFFVLLDALRRAAPAELQDQFTRFLREGLMALRSLIDWYLERLDRPPREPRVEDIPID